MESSLEKTEPIEQIDIKNLDSLLTFDEHREEVDIITMASLKHLLLVNHVVNRNCLPEGEDDDHKLKRVSLAYEKLHSIPKILLIELSQSVRILDISHNRFYNLDFLSTFKNLTSVICDRNEIDSDSTLPFLPKLELLYLNHCKIKFLYPWAKKLQRSCPNLRYLSLMGNPAVPENMCSEQIYQYLRYRSFIISLFPHLVHLDDRPVTKDERFEAHKVYSVHFMEKFLLRTQGVLPEYFRNLSNAVSDMFSTPPTYVSQQPPRNSVI